MLVLHLLDEKKCSVQWNADDLVPTMNIIFHEDKTFLVKMAKLSCILRSSLDFSPVSYDACSWL